MPLPSQPVRLAQAVFQAAQLGQATEAADGRVAGVETGLGEVVDHAQAVVGTQGHALDIALFRATRQRGGVCRCFWGDAEGRVSATPRFTPRPSRPAGKRSRGGSKNS